MCGEFKYQRLSQCNSSEFKNDDAMLFEKRNVDTQRTTKNSDIFTQFL